MHDVTLFHIWPSLCSQKVRLALVEKNVAYESHIVNIGPAMENYEPWYVRMNPSAVVPTLRHGERIVTDSARIVRYIDEAFPGPRLTPSDAAARDEMNSWIDAIDRIPFRTVSYAQPSAWRTGAVQRLVGFRVRRLRSLAAKNADLREAYEKKLADVMRWQDDVAAPDAIAAARAEASRVVASVEERLADGRAFLVGSEYSLADVLATVALARMKTLGLADWQTDPKRTRVAAYYGRMRERPSFRAASVWERVQPKQIARLVVPFVAPRLAAALALGAGIWLAAGYIAK